LGSSRDDVRSVGELRERFTSHGWRTDALDDAAVAELIEIASIEASHVAHAPGFSAE